VQEALQTAQGIASKSAHSELKSAHVLLALLQQEGGITAPILQKAGVDVGRLKAAVAAALAREPSVQGATTQPQISVGLRATLDAADQAASRWATTT
jgi:ATP-dependent Clp protease ATP-binding subunit ClpB